MPAAGNFAGAQMESMTVSAAFNKRFRKQIRNLSFCLAFQNGRLTAIVFVLRLFHDNFSCQGGRGTAISPKTIVRRAFIWRPLTPPVTPWSACLVRWDRKLI